MRRLRTLFPIATLLALALAPSGVLASPFTGMRGHLSFGYTKLFGTVGVVDPEAVPPEEIKAPGGSMAVAAGLDLPVTPNVRAGIEAGVDLLGSTAVDRGSLFAELDYSVFEVLGLVHWTPPWGGPLGRLSLGPGLFKARADLSSAGPAAFEDLPVLEWAPGLAATATLITRKDTKVSAGIELGTRWIALSDDDWILATARVVIHY